MQKGQGSLQQLLLVGGVLVLAIIVVSIVVSLPQPVGEETKNTTINLYCSQKPVERCVGEQVTVDGVTFFCAVSLDGSKCVWDQTPGSGVPTQCSNGVKDSGETDTDCGGTLCSQCTNGKNCSANPDCISGNCDAATNTCIAPYSCGDDICSAVENCPADSADCQEPSICFTASCTSGCVNGSIAAGLEDEDGGILCNEFTGCQDPPCACNSSSNCVPIVCSGNPNACSTYSNHTACDDAGCNWIATTQEGVVYSESFESNFGLWTQDTNDNGDWNRINGPTPTLGTGPMDAPGGNYYIYSSGGSVPWEDRAILLSPPLDLISVSFYYHIYKEDLTGPNCTGVGNIQLEIDDGTGGWIPLWIGFCSTIQGSSQGWRTTTVSLAAYTGAIRQLRFIAQRGANYADMALDLIDITHIQIVYSCSESPAPCASLRSEAICQSAGCTWGT